MSPTAGINRPTLATDLDGTLIPLSSHTSVTKPDSGQLPSEIQAPFDSHSVSLQMDALGELRSVVATGALQMVFVTGRHQQSVLRVMLEQQLPTPQWIICDVGTTLLERVGNDYRVVEDYSAYLEQISSGYDSTDLPLALSGDPDLVLQEPEKQSRFKRSYYCDRARLDQHANQIRASLEQRQLPYELICSVDPFNGDGLIDLLPRSINKSTALLWWAHHMNFDPDDIVFAGDSGNDWAALTSGLKSILVGNAADELTKRVLEYHRQASSLDRLYVARAPATAGVLEGCHWFGLLPE